MEILEQKQISEESTKVKLFKKNSHILVIDKKLVLTISSFSLSDKLKLSLMFDKPAVKKIASIFLPP